MAGLGARGGLVLIGGCFACESVAVPERSGLVGDVIVRELTDEDVVTLCRWMVPRMREADGALPRCTASAVRSAADQAECFATRDRCVASFGEGTLEADLAACDGVVNSIFHEDCGAPVGLIEDCVLEVLALRREENLSCERFRDRGQPEDLEAESCRPLWSECFP